MQTGLIADVDLKKRIKSCDICNASFAATKTQHRPNPIVWFDRKALVLIAGQAPGLKVYQDGRPFWDKSGDRLRDWLGVTKDEFYALSNFAIVPMAFCFPGYNSKGADLPPPKVCADTWRADVMENFKSIKLTILVGGYAQKWHLGTEQTVTKRVKDWRKLAPKVFVLPHPSWRNSGWLKRNPAFELDVVPALRQRVREILDGR